MQIVRLALVWLSLGVLLSACPTEGTSIVVSVRPPQGVTIDDYTLELQDRSTRAIVYKSGLQPVGVAAQGRDLFADPLRVGLKLMQGGDYVLVARASSSADKGLPVTASAPYYFFASLVTVTGTVEVDASLLLVPVGQDRDGDGFPDAITWPATNADASARYAGHPELLDCFDDPAAKGTFVGASLKAADIHPLAEPRCGVFLDGMPFSVSCDAMPTMCPDADGDGDPSSTDCDDADPNRFTGNARPRNCCQCTDVASCATNHAKRPTAQCEPARCDSSFDYDCTGKVVPCFVDDDCDGYSPNDPDASLRDCDDTNAAVHPGATKVCSDPTHDWACDGAPAAGCIDMAVPDMAVPDMAVPDLAMPDLAMPDLAMPDMVVPTGDMAQLTASFSSITGTDVAAFGSLFQVRGLEFDLSSTVKVSSVVVDGLPVGQESTAILWHKTGAVDLQVTDTFPLGAQILPSTTGAGSATFTFATPLSLGAGTHSLVLRVDDLSSTGDWSLRQIPNNGVSYTVGGTTFASVWGWYGDVDTNTNIASTVSIYDATYFRIPRITLTIAP